MKINIKQIGVKHLTIFGSIIGAISVGSIWTTNQYSIKKTVESMYEAGGRDTVEIHHETHFAPVYYVKDNGDVTVVEPDSVSGDSVLTDDGWMKLVWPFHDSKGD